MGGILLILSVAWGMDCSLEAPLQRAETAILSLDLDGGQTALNEAKSALSCGSTPVEDLARYWLLTAAHADFSGNTSRVEDALVAARSTSTTYYVDLLGSDLKAKWAAATPAKGQAFVKLNDLPDGFGFRIDGKVSSGSVAPGFHVVQAAVGEEGFGQIVRASAGDTIQLSTGLKVPDVVVAVTPAPVTIEPLPDLVPRPSSGGIDLSVHLGLGLSGVFGTSFQGEPGVKSGPVVEVGVVVRPSDGWWIRAMVQGDFLLAGKWTYDADGTVQSLPIAPGFVLGGGLTLNRTLDLGVQLGQQLPGRLPIRGVVHYFFTDSLGVELRGGMNLKRLVTRVVEVESAASVHFIVEL